MKFNQIKPIRQLAYLAVAAGLIELRDGQTINDMVSGMSTVNITNRPDESIYIRNKPLPTDNPIYQSITFLNLDWNSVDTDDVIFSARSYTEFNSLVSRNDVGERFNLTTDLRLSGTVIEMLNRAREIILSTRFGFHQESIDWRLNVIDKMLEQYPKALELDEDTLKTLTNASAAKRLMEKLNYQALSPGLIQTPGGMILISFPELGFPHDRNCFEISLHSKENFTPSVPLKVPAALYLDLSLPTKIQVSFKELSSIVREDGIQQQTITLTPLGILDIVELTYIHGVTTDKLDNEYFDWWDMVTNEIESIVMQSQFSDKFVGFFPALRAAVDINIENGQHPF